MLSIPSENKKSWAMMLELVDKGQESEQVAFDPVAGSV
jgi:hypothetical protein